MDKNITLHDQEWFTGNIGHFNISCKDCNKPETKDDLHISLKNHINTKREVVYVGEPVYDL